MSLSGWGSRLRRWKELRNEENFAWEKQKRLLAMLGPVWEISREVST
jgi:hypothetical protein